MPQANTVDMERPLGFREIFGLSPLSKRLEETRFMLKGDPHTPPSRFDHTSLKLLWPKLSLKTWMGHKRANRLVPLSNLFNRTPTPIEEGWSVRVTQVEDFRGGENTYDSHNGTDFAIPVGTIVTSPAPGQVIRVSNEFHRGGLKVFIDHGRGIISTSNHLGRALVQPGQRVERGEPIALSGASGVDCFAAFPWTVPHVHFNVWLEGKNIDPFARPDEECIWRRRNNPAPYTGEQLVMDEHFEPTDWDLDALDRAIDSCNDPSLQSEFRAQRDPVLRTGDVLFYMNYFPTRFTETLSLYPAQHERVPILDLPFGADDFDGIVHPDE